MSNYLLAKILRPKLLEIDDSSLDKGELAALTKMIRWCNKELRQGDAS